MTKYAEIRMEASTLRPGQTSHNLLCPWCRGGRNATKNFYITRAYSGSVLYCCHRSRCGVSGVIDDYTQYTPTAPPAFVPNPFTEPYTSLDLVQRKQLGEKYCVWALNMLGWASTASGTLVMPVYDPGWQIRGHMTRREAANGGKIVTSWKMRDEPWQCWYIRTRHPAILYIVEDQISAARLWQAGRDAVALLGTHLSQEKANEIRRSYVEEIPQKTDYRIILCLDKDATAKAIEYKRKYDSYLGNLEVKFLSKDIKNMSCVELEEFLK